MEYSIQQNTCTMSSNASSTLPAYFLPMYPKLYPERDARAVVIAIV